MLLREKLMSAMGALGLYGMKGTFDEVIATGIKQRATPEKILLDLLEAEMAELPRPLHDPQLFGTLKILLGYFP